MSPSSSGPLEPTALGELESLAALVTGSSHGIGREVALALGAAGARVVVNGTPDAAGRSRAAEASWDCGSLIKTSL